MSRHLAGRYRRGQALRGQARRHALWRVLLAVCIPVIAAVGTLYAVAVHVSVPGESHPATLDGSAMHPSDRPDAASRSADRRLDRTETDHLNSASKIRAILPSRMVNGRRQPVPVDPPQSGEGTYLVASDDIPPLVGGSGEIVRYIVEIEQGLPFVPDDFAADVHTILSDGRGWGHDQSIRFEQVDDGPVGFRVSLSSATLTDEQCHPLRTRGKVSCWNGSRAVINAERWGAGAETYGSDLLSYREYVINHEVGHALGHAHVGCPGGGEPAPVMVQQTKSLEGCALNPWPHP